jgi:hypothetical protein
VGSVYEGGEVKHLFFLALVSVFGLSACEQTSSLSNDYYEKNIFFSKYPGVSAEIISADPRQTAQIWENMRTKLIEEQKANPKAALWLGNTDAYGQWMTLNLEANRAWAALVSCNGGDAELARKNYFLAKNVCALEKEKSTATFRVLTELHHNVENVFQSGGILSISSLYEMHPLLAQILWEKQGQVRTKYLRNIDQHWLALKEKMKTDWWSPRNNYSAYKENEQSAARRHFLKDVLSGNFRIDEGDLDFLWEHLLEKDHKSFCSNRGLWPNGSLFFSLELYEDLHTEAHGKTIVNIHPNENYRTSSLRGSYNKEDCFAENQAEFQSALLKLSPEWESEDYYHYQFREGIDERNQEKFDGALDDVVLNIAKVCGEYARMWDAYTKEEK